MSSVARLVSETVEEEGLRPVQEYLPFVKKIAMRMARRLPSHIELDDLISAGLVGLMEAEKRYDVSRAINFEKFAEFRIKGAILDELRRRDLMARDARLESKNIESAINSITNDLGRQPEEEEIAQYLNISVDDLRIKMEKLTPVRVVSLGDVLPTTLPADNNNPFDNTLQNEMIERLQKAIAKLPTRQQQVLNLYYQEDLTLKEIGTVLEVTESRICQIMSEATIRLRSMLNPGAKTKSAPKKRK